jgi:cold shock CspA family protein
MTIDNAALRQFILQFFGDEDLDTLCFDYFPEAHQNFTIGMTKNRKALLLIGYCETRDRMEDLYAALARERKEAWNQAFAAPPVQTGHRPVLQPAPERDPRQIFLSHATSDAEFAHNLAADLRAESWRVWIAPESIRPGEEWVEAIDRGLETSGIFLVVLTPEAVASRWVNTETDAAIEMQHEGLIAFIPLDRSACQPKRLWRQYQYVPFRGSYEVGLVALLRRLDEEPATPVATQHPPAVASTAQAPSQQPSQSPPQRREAEIVGPKTITIDPQTGKYVGRVKWYNVKKGYGYILRGAGEEIFFHKSATVGEIEEFEEGQWLLYDVETTTKGPEACDIEPYTSQQPSQTPPQQRAPEIVGPKTIQIDPITGKYLGRVKWYNAKKGYGFIVRDAREELFFHKSATVGEIEEFEDGQWVLYDVETTAKGPEASDVEPYTGEPLE